jgi:hypothetical protein
VSTLGDVLRTAKVEIDSIALVLNKAGGTQKYIGVIGAELHAG